MGKRYGAAKAMSVSVVGSFNAPVSGKANIIEVDSHNANRDYKNQEGYRLPNLEEIYHIPSSIKREWGKMSKAEKIVY